MRYLVLFLFAITLAPLAAQEVSPSANRKAPPPSTDPADKYRIDGSEEWYLSIKDNALFPWKVKERELGKDADLYSEEFAYESALIHAAQFTHAELEAAARRDVSFGSLIDNERLSYKLELVHFEGRLRRLQRVEVTPRLKLQNVEAVYEAWVFPVGEATPMCVFISELPAGLEPQKDLKEHLDRPVAVTGYYFKLVRYEQQGFDRSKPGKHKIWAAPVIIGRSLTLLSESDIVDAGMAWRMRFVPIAIGGFTLLALCLVYASWRYRRGDREEAERMRERRNQNPFENV